MYAILDIETTGGKFNEEGITEIAIYKFDGHEIVDQFISLVNPEIPIQPFVVKLTGINSSMLVNAPKFFEVAKRIVEITSDCVIVAHNANFDNRILTTEFRRLGYDFERKTLCTVELSKKLIPDLTSYKLGNLCHNLGIPISSRHRADGDAYATYQLFKLLLNKDSDKEIVKQAVKTENPKKLAPKLQQLLDEVTTKAGIFYLHNSISEIIYIGKGKNLKKEVTKLFLKTTSKTIKLTNEAVSISYEETGNELITHLKYIEELKINKPVFNIKNNYQAKQIKFSNENLMIVNKGRFVGEKSVILIENNKIMGYCFTDLTYQISNLEILRTLISPLKNSALNREIIKNYLQKNKVEKIIRI